MMTAAQHWRLDLMRAHPRLFEIMADQPELSLDDTCQQRTGRLEEDGCWPAIE